MKDMKRRKLSAFSAIAALVAALASCIAPITDVYPIMIYISVSNEDGENLLDSITPNSFAGKEIRAEWMEGTYVADTISLWEKEALGVTRYYMPMMDGLMYRVKDGKQVLCFGELAGDEDFDNEPLTLHWPDGTTDVITVKANGTLFTRKYKLNGEVVAKDTRAPMINIVK